jgi:hypothetical protein
MPIKALVGLTGLVGISRALGRSVTDAMAKEHRGTHGNAPAS